VVAKPLSPLAPNKPEKDSLFAITLGLFEVFEQENRCDELDVEAEAAQSLA
jgi:hypothetical protein